MCVRRDCSPRGTIPDDVDVEGRHVVPACDQHRRLGSGDGEKLVTVRCAGAISLVEAGEDVFSSSSAGCSVCHSLEPGVRLVGPSLANIGTSASSRITGVSAEEYLRQSILAPDAYVLDGYPAGQMLDIYEETLTDEEIDSLVAYLMSLEEES